MGLEATEGTSEPVSVYWIPVGGAIALGVLLRESRSGCISASRRRVSLNATQRYSDSTLHYFTCHMFRSAH